MKEIIKKRKKIVVNQVNMFWAKNIKGGGIFLLWFHFEKLNWTTDWSCNDFKLTTTIKKKLHFIKLFIELEAIFIFFISHCVVSNFDLVYNSNQQKKKFEVNFPWFCKLHKNNKIKREKSYLIDLQFFFFLQFWKPDIAIFKLSHIDTHVVGLLAPHPLF